MLDLPHLLRRQPDIMGDKPTIFVNIFPVAGCRQPDIEATRVVNKADNLIRQFNPMQSQDVSFWICLLFLSVIPYQE